MKLGMKKLINVALLHSIVFGNWAIFQLVKSRDRSFRDALEGFEATYQFRTDKSGRRLIFTKGRIQCRGSICETPDYELMLIDPKAVLVRLVKNPDDMISLLMENKIDQRGNNYYLFKYGYLLGLCQKYFERLFHKDKVNHGFSNGGYENERA